MSALLAKIAQDCEPIHSSFRFGCLKPVAMARKNWQPSFDPHGDLRIDYALIATGLAAALIGLAYLFLN